MFMHIYKNELKSFFKSSSFLNFLFIMAIIIFLECFLSSLGSAEIFSMNMGSNLIIYVVLSQLICNTHNKFKNFSHQEEFYLSKPFLRSDLFKANFLKVCTLCGFIMMVIIVAHFMTSSSFDSIVRIEGYDNILLADQSDKLIPVNEDKESEEYFKEDMQKVSELIQAGNLEEASNMKKEGYFSKKYHVENLFLYNYAIKFMFLIWCSICGIIFISSTNIKAPLDIVRENLKYPLGYLKMSGWVCVFIVIFMPLFYLRGEGLLEQQSSNLLSYFENFNLIMSIFFAFTIVLIFITKRSYQRISL